MWRRERAEAECTGVAAAPYCSRSFRQCCWISGRRDQGEHRVWLSGIAVVGIPVSWCQVDRGADGLFVCERE